MSGVPVISIESAAAHDQHLDRVTPAWRRFWNERCWPAWRLDRCTLDELRRLRKAVPYLLEAIDRAISSKEGIAR